MTATYFSTTSLAFFSAASSSSSSKEILRLRPSVVVLLWSASSIARLPSVILPSAFSSSASRRESLWVREPISCSFSSRVCSSFLFFASASSARASALSASARSWARRYMRSTRSGTTTAYKQVQAHLLNLIHCSSCLDEVLR